MSKQKYRVIFLVPQDLIGTLVAAADDERIEFVSAEKTETRAQAKSGIPRSDSPRSHHRRPAEEVDEARKSGTERKSRNGVPLTNAEPAPRFYAANGIRGLVMDFLKTDGGSPKHVTAIAKITEGTPYSPNSISPALMDLVIDGKVKRIDKGTYKVV